MKDQVQCRNYMSMNKETHVNTTFHHTHMDICIYACVMVYVFMYIHTYFTLAHLIYMKSSVISVQCDHYFLKLTTTYDIQLVATVLIKSDSLRPPHGLGSCVRMHTDCMVRESIVS